MMLSEFVVEGEGGPVAVRLLRLDGQLLVAVGDARQALDNLRVGLPARFEEEPLSHAVIRSVALEEEAESAIERTTRALAARTGQTVFLSVNLPGLTPAELTQVLSRLRAQLPALLAGAPPPGRKTFK